MRHQHDLTTISQFLKPSFQLLNLIQNPRMIGIEPAFSKTWAVISDQRGSYSICNSRKQIFPGTPIIPSASLEQNRYAFAFDDMEMKLISANIHQCVNILAFNS